MKVMLGFNILLDVTHQRETFLMFAMLLQTKRPKTMSAIPTINNQFTFHNDDFS